MDWGVQVTDTVYIHRYVNRLCHQSYYITGYVNSDVVFILSLCELVLTSEAKQAEMLSGVDSFHTLI